MAFQQPSQYYQTTPTPTCQTCNHRGHPTATCFLTHPALLSDFLQARPDRRVYWERRVEEYRGYLERVSRRIARASRQNMTLEQMAARDAEIAERHRHANERKAEAERQKAQRNADYDAYIATQQCYRCNQVGHYARICNTGN